MKKCISLPLGWQAKRFKRLRDAEEFKEEVDGSLAPFGKQWQVIFSATGLNRWALPVRRRNDKDVRYGMHAVIELVKEWDRQLAPAVNGFRFSDIVACKLNLTVLKKPRKVRA